MGHRARTYTLAQQYASVAYFRELGGTGKLTRHGFTVEFAARPTPLSRSYTIRITMRRNQPPRVYVTTPRLSELAGDRQIPHLYSRENQQLCLYLPQTGEWSSGKSVGLAIVPWVFLWLYFFEEWLFSDEWKGGGVHPGRSDDGGVSPATPQTST